MMDPTTAAEIFVFAYMAMLVITGYLSLRSSWLVRQKCHPDQWSYNKMMWHFWNWDLRSMRYPAEVSVDTPRLASTSKFAERHPLLLPKSHTMARFHGGELPGWDGTIEDLNRFLPKARSAVKPKTKPLTIEEKIELRKLFEGLLDTAEVEEWRCYTGDLVYSSKAPQVHVVIKAIQDILNK
jgi:hypothetical protein